MSILDIDTNNVLLEHICNKYCEIMGYVPKFIKDDEIDEQDVFDNPYNYIMGRKLKSEYDSSQRITTSFLYIKIFKVAPNFDDIFPNGKYVDEGISSMYLSPSHHISHVLKYINNTICQYYPKTSI